MSVNKAHGHHHAHKAHHAKPASLKAQIKAEVQKELKAQLPKLRDQFAAGANATGGGSAATGGSLPAPSTQGVWASSGGDLNLDNVFGNLQGAEGKMNQDLTDISKLDASAPDYQGKLLKLQTEIQNIQRMFDTISQMLKSMHDTKMQIIGNLK